jgi:hypothetical protein
MPETNYRALCVEILQKLDQYEDGQRVDWDAWRNNARAELAQPEPEGVTDAEWDELVARAWDEYETVGYQGERFMYDIDFGNALDFMRKELTRQGHPTPQPELVTVSHPLLVQLEQYARSCAADAREANEGSTQAYWNGFLAAVMQFQVFSARPQS